MKNFLILLFAISLYNPPASAQYEEEDLVDYESIVRQLSQSNRTRTPRAAFNYLDDIRFHLGVGIVNSMSTIGTDSGELKAGVNGVQTNFGIDLFSYEWRAEGGITNFENYKDTDTGTSYKMQEFDLKLVYSSQLSKIWGYKIGGGLAGRYMRVTKDDLSSQEFTTPSTNLHTGIVTRFSKSVALSTDLVYRRALISETPDKSAIDFTIRVDGTF
ncbi:MAG: hypothetical protein AB8E15_13030 [Bdellovibrionales bacterium]